MEIPPLVFAIFNRLCLVSGNVLDYRDDYVSLASESQHALPFLPVAHIESREIDAGTVKTLRLLRHPGPQGHGEVFSEHHRLAPEDVCIARHQYAQAVDFQPVQPLNGVLDGSFVPEAHQPERRRAVKEVMLAGAFPDEMPWIFRI